MTNDQALDHHLSGASPSRRQVLFAGAGALAAAVLNACGKGDGASTAPAPATNTLAPTPGCDGDELTPAQTEGPYFKADSPQRADLRSGAGGGMALNLTGTVLTTACQPVDRAKIEFWQADANGDYDNSGYTLRGHQFTDGQGRYAVQTVVPGLYPGRTSHIHATVQAPNGKVLTTQLYFPGVIQNESDGFYQSECLIDIKDSPSGQEGKFTFVLNG